MRVMGLDIGTKNIGVAVSDEMGMIAQGREVVKRVSNDKAISRIKELAEEFHVKKIVVGLPVNMDGSKGARAEDSLKFGEKIKEVMDIPVMFWDERLSTREMENVMIRASVSRKNRKKKIDKMAAQIILQGYLDSCCRGDSM